MKIGFKNFFLSIAFCCALTKGIQAADQAQPITVGDYQIFLTAVATTQDLHGLYQPEMTDQIVCESNGAQKIYQVITGQEREPMHNMKRLGAIRYCNWKDHHEPNENEDPVAASLSTETGTCDLQGNQIIAIHLEAAYQLTNDGEVEGEFWIINKGSSTTASPLMLDWCCWVKGEKDSHQSMGDIEAGRHDIDSDMEDSSSAAGRGHAVCASERSFHQASSTTWYEKIKQLWSNILHWLERFCCCWRRGAQNSVSARASLIQKITIALANDKVSVVELAKLRNELRSWNDAQRSLYQATTYISDLGEKIREKRNEVIFLPHTAIHSALGSLVKKLGFHVDHNTPLGEGGFGCVYRVVDGAFGESLIYKEEKQLNWATEMCGEGQIHREGNLVAASGIFPNFVNIRVLLLDLKEKNGLTISRQYCYLPQSHVNNFQAKLLDPKNQIIDFAVVGQLMERAAGEEVEQTLTSSTWRWKSLKERLNYFDAIVPEIWKYYEVALPNNFVHRDIKGPNLFFDWSKRKLTILDPGIAGQLDRVRTSYEKMRSWMNGSKKPSHDTSSQGAGTMIYLAPAVAKEEPYGAEVDAFAFGKILLEIIDKETCDRIWRQQCQNMNKAQDIDEFDQCFLSKAKDCLEFITQDCLLKTFLTSKDPLMQQRRKLIDAFLALGWSHPGNVVTNARDWKWSALKASYQAYHNAISKTESSAGK